MKQPSWKNWLSYLFEIVLERGATELNPDLQLGLKKGRYCLSTPHAIYSYSDLYRNFHQSFQKLNIAEKKITDVLVLGFGLGSIPYLLEKNFQKKCHYIGVEADEQIAIWASEYVLDEISSPVQMNITDALYFVEICEQKFDLITMDIFIDNEVPLQFETKEYLLKLKSLLNKNGILMYNRFTLREKDKLNTASFFENKFKAVFPNGRYFDLGGNWMLLNG